MMAALFPEIDRQAGGWHGGKQWRRLRCQSAPVTGPAGRNGASRR